MRLLTALGLFLIIAGAMLLVLQPSYRVPHAVDVHQLEAVGPVDETRPIPPWVGVVSIVIGGAALLLERRRAAARAKKIV